MDIFTMWHSIPDLHKKFRQGKRITLELIQAKAHNHVVRTLISQSYILNPL